MEELKTKAAKFVKLPSGRALLALFGLLVICDIAFISSSGWTRLSWNLLGYGGLFAIFKYAKLTPSNIGLSKAKLIPGLKYGLAVIAVILLVLLVIYLVDKQLFKDPRYHHSLATALYSVLVLLPLKTVLFEELAFRGIMPALGLKIKNSRRFATLLSSLAFGLWHINSATKIGDYHLSGGISVPNQLVVAGVVIATSAAGYLFCVLRWRSGSLVAPIAVHWFINGFGTILAALSWK